MAQGCRLSTTHVFSEKKPKLIFTQNRQLDFAKLAVTKNKKNTFQRNPRTIIIKDP